MAAEVLEYESRRKARIKEKKKKRNKFIIATMIAVFILIILYIIGQSRCDYYVFKNEVKTDENNGVTYELFASGYIKYSGNGIEYQKKFGVPSWNYSLVYSKPFVSKSQSYILVADRGGNNAVLYDENGLVQSYSTKAPIIQGSVSNKGYFEVILQGDNCNYIVIYDKSGKIIAETENSLNETGYPVTAAISPDGTKFVVSYYTIEDLKGVTRMAFYDLSKQLKKENDSMIGSINYEKALIPEIHFVDNNRVVAFGNDNLYVYNVSDKPKEIKNVAYKGSIESVFCGDKYFGYICEQDEDEARYHVYLYKKNGKEQMNTAIDMNYNKIFMIGNEVLATQDNECTIINNNGKILFQGTLEGGNIENVLSSPGWRTYRVIFDNKVVKMKLSFFGSKK